MIGAKDLGFELRARLVVQKFVLVLGGLKTWRLQQVDLDSGR